MRLTIEIDDKFKAILEDLRSCGGFETPEDFCKNEIDEIIKENLAEYGYNHDGSIMEVSHE